MSVLAVCAASIAILASACKKDEPASETNTTSAPITPDQPAVNPQTPTQTPDQTSTGTVNDSTHQEPTKSLQSSTNGVNGQSKAKSPSTPSGGTDLIDHNTNMNGAGTTSAGTTSTSSTTNPSQENAHSTQSSSNQQNQQHQPQANGAQNQKNHSTTLGDGKSGEYTGGKGTNGGKATWGTGPRKDTKMDQPTP